MLGIANIIVRNGQSNHGTSASQFTFDIKKPTNTDVWTLGGSF